MMQKVPGGEREGEREGGKKEREVRRATDRPLSRLPRVGAVSREIPKGRRSHRKGLSLAMGNEPSATSASNIDRMLYKETLTVAFFVIMSTPSGTRMLHETIDFAGILLYTNME